MSMMDIIWDYFIQNNSTNLFIHSSSGFEPLPRFQVRSTQDAPNPVKSSLIFWVLSPNSPIIHRLTSHGIFNPRKLLCLIYSILIDSSSYDKKGNNVFYKKLFSNLVF